MDMKKLFSIFLLLIPIFSFSQEECPDGINTNNNNNPNFTDTIFVYNSDFEIYDTLICNVSGNSGDYDCDEIIDGYYYVYSSQGDTCYYDSDGDIISTPLPIELTSFEAVNFEEINIITWKTASESNNSHFLLSRSTDGETWEVIALISGAGNSIQPLEYSYEDKHFTNTINYYKLTQVDYDGQSETFNPISVDNRLKSNRELVKVINIMGQEVGEFHQGLTIYLYNDGTSEKVLR